MRSGKLLAEQSPQLLLEQYGCQSLEEVFLLLSRKQGNQDAVPKQLPQPSNHTTTDNPNVGTMNWGNKDDSIFVTEESGIVGINFHQSKEVLIQDNTNGHVDVIIISNCT